MIICVGAMPLYAQNKATRHVVQVSGLVVSGDSLYGIPGVAVYIPKSGRGITTNYLGYFSLPVLTGDSIVINSLGYKVKHYVVPENIEDKLSLIVELMTDTILLPTVEVFPWPTEQLFKEAFLSLKLPEHDYDNMNHNLNEQVMKRMLYTSSASGSENHRYYMQKQMQSNDMKNNIVNPAMVFMNPFAWAKFIKDVKKGKLKSTLRERDFSDEDE